MFRIGSGVAMPARSVAVLAVTLIFAGAYACSSKTGDLCERAVAHVFDLTVVGEISAAERQLIGTVMAATRDACRLEGLSPEQAQCIFAARGVDWDQGLRQCPAFVAKPLSWVIVRPPRDQRGHNSGGEPDLGGSR